MLETITKTVISVLTKSLFTNAVEAFGQKGIRENCIPDHMTEIENWSSRMEFFELPEAVPIDSVSIPLDISRAPRMFQPLNGNKEIFNEDAFLTSNNHYILLGAPGAGKTTTLKRLARQVLMHEPKSSADIYCYPIVLRFKELDPSLTLNEHIANVLGIDYTIVKVENSEIPRRQLAKKTSSGDDLKIALSRFLNDTKAILILDGLDETFSEEIDLFRVDLIKLARLATSFKIIVSCRTGDYNASIEGFDACEICSLSVNQIKTITHYWTDTPEKFFSSLQKTPI